MPMTPINTFSSEKETQRVTLNQWFETWMSGYKAGRIKPTSIDTYRAVYNKHIRTRFGERLLTSFLPVHIQCFYNSFISSGYSAKYLNTLHTILNSLFKTALINGLIPLNPCSLIDRPAAVSPERRILSPDEQFRLTSVLKRPAFRFIEPLVTTLLGTGMRIGELLGLRWEDITLTKEDASLFAKRIASPLVKSSDSPISYLSVRRTLVRVKNEHEPGSRFILQAPKTKKSIRSIPLQKSVLSALCRQSDLLLSYRDQNIRSQNQEFDDLIFVGKKGQPQWRSSVVSAIDTVVQTINREEIQLAHDRTCEPKLMAPILPHDLRHTFATRSLEAGIPPKVVQGWLGHAGIQITLDLYTHVSFDLSAHYMKDLENSMKNSVE